MYEYASILTMGNNFLFVSLDDKSEYWENGRSAMICIGSVHIKCETAD